MLEHAFNLIIGVEFIKMLAKHTPGSAIEVLLFAIARQMVIEHTTPVENLVGIVTIALIFIIRKYLFVPSFGAHVPGTEAALEAMEEKAAPAPQAGCAQPCGPASGGGARLPVGKRGHGRHNGLKFSAGYRKTPLSGRDGCVCRLDAPLVWRKTARCKRPSTGTENAANRKS